MSLFVWLEACKVAGMTDVQAQRALVQAVTQSATYAWPMFQRVAQGRTKRKWRREGDRALQTGAVHEGLAVPLR